MAKRCVYLASDAEWVVARMQRLALQYDIHGLSRSAIIMAGLSALNDCNEAEILEQLRAARDTRWDRTTI